MKVLIPIVAVLAVVGGLAAVKANQIGTLIEAGEAMQKAGPPPETVSSAEVRKERWTSTLTSVGSVEAGKGVAISNDSPGIVTRIRFESGDKVKAGQVLVELDTSVERAQLASAEARLGLATTTLNRTRALIKEGVGTGAELDSAEASVKSATAEVSALRGQIARKVIEAPFTGKLGIRNVNVGQYLSPGTAITTLQSEKEEYVDFSLPQQYFDKLRTGLPVNITARETGIDLKGVVAAIDPAVDPVTRSVTLRATTTDPDKKLRPGMFVNVSVALDSQREVVTVPVTSVVYAPYGDSVFVLEDDPKAASAPNAPPTKVARQQFVKLGETRGDFVEALKGLKGNETVVSAGAFKLRNGARVTINNKVGLAPQMDPRPDNR